MQYNNVIGKEATDMYHSFGKIRKGLVVKYIWHERHAEMFEEDGYWYLDQEVYKRVYDNPERRWELVSSRNKLTKNIDKFVKLIECYGFSANWPTYEMPPITCPIKY